MYQPQSANAEEFISPDEIADTLRYAAGVKGDMPAIDAILAKARAMGGLNHREASALLACDDPDKNAEIAELAFAIKQEFYGNRIVLFAPLYLSNYCVNGCRYCPYHAGSGLARKKLTQDEIRAEAAALQAMGHKRLAIEAGEDPIHNPIEYILESIETIYSVRHGNGAIRRANVNIAATSVENYRRLRDAGIGTYILFQETYNKAAYGSLHPSGPKSDYAFHTEAMDRAMRGGIDDVGLGVLFGLEQYASEFAALLMHAEHLEAAFGVGPHTISIPRIQPAHGVEPGAFGGGVSDAVLEKIAACIRIAVPYTGMIVSTRETKSVREKLLRVGVSQISGASRTSVGGYADGGTDGIDSGEDTRQFEVADTRSLDDVVQWLIETDYVPSFCTACYREGRTGDRFMALCKSRQILNCCHPNALMTLKEYLLDYASPQTRAQGERLIEAELGVIPKEAIRALVRKNLAAIEGGQRDFRL